MFQYKFFFFQGVIRASVTPGQSATQVKPTTPSLGIQLPVPTVGSREQNYPQPASTVHSDKNEVEEDDEDEDDWDNFQSFPASANVAGSDPNEESVVEEPDQVENPSVSKTNAGSDFSQEHSVSQPSDNINESSNTDQEAGEGEVTQGDGTSVDRDMTQDIFTVEGPRDFQSDENSTEPRDNQKYEREEVPREEREEKVESSQLSEQIPTDIDSVEAAERSAEVNIDVAHELRKEESSDIKIEALLSVSEPLEPLPLDEEAVNSKDQIQLKEADKESQKESMAEKESDEQKPESSSGSKSPKGEKDEDAKL